MADVNLQENLLTCEPIYQGAILNVEKWQAQLPNGAEAVREMLRELDSSNYPRMTFTGYAVQKDTSIADAAAAWNQVKNL